MNRYAPLALLSLFVAFPALAAQGQPGTDSYLRDELGMTAEALSAKVPTEGRDAFGMAIGAGTAEDPLGDVVDRWGRSSTLNKPWGDVSRVVAKRDEGGQAWEFTVTLGGSVPAKPPEKANLLIYADQDGDRENNARDGVKDGMDAEFALQHNPDQGWYTDFRWYNAAEGAKVWATNKETSSRFRIKEGVITYVIPFAELPDTEPRWRAVMGISDGERTQIDVVPTVGFPPPKGTAVPPPPTFLERLQEGPAALAALGAAACLLAGGFLWKNRQSKRR